MYKEDMNIKSSIFFIYIKEYLDKDNNIHKIVLRHKRTILRRSNRERRRNMSPVRGDTHIF